MKRLKCKLLSMQNDTATYKEMYEGSMTIIGSGFKIDDYSPVYYNGDIGFEITLTHKLAQDKPTVTIIIPYDMIIRDPNRCTQFDGYATAVADFCLRKFKKYIDVLNEDLYHRSRPDKEIGKYYLCVPGGEILIRNTAFFSVCPQRDYEPGGGSTVYLLPEGQRPQPKTCLCIRMQVQLPSKKLRKTIQMLCRDLPDAVDRFINEFDLTELNRVLELAEKQAAIREWLKHSNYCAFIANGSILPRAKGTDLPMPGAIPFRSTSDDEIEICGVRGMGIRKGVTVITGGGYSGKSTLLDAISVGIYNHTLGDGREFCITDESAVTISAEDGRSQYFTVYQMVAGRQHKRLFNRPCIRFHLAGGEYYGGCRLRSKAAAH